MSYAAQVIREAESREDEARDHSDAIEKLWAAVGRCNGDFDKLADLLESVMGPKLAAEVIRDYLLGDSDALNDRVVGWAS